jgi:hypothetical protein
MRRAVAPAAVLLVAAAVGCGEPLPVRLDLCPARGTEAGDLDTLRRVDLWSVEVWGVSGDDVVWRRTFAGADSVRSLDLSGAIPPGEEVRLTVEGYGLDEAGERRLLALAASDPLRLDGLDSVCLCIAPPERYEALCDGWVCEWSQNEGQCVDG